MTRGKKKPARTIFTVGHSTRTDAAFIELLQSHEITLLVDVRTVPRSRHNPQFNNDVLPDSLSAAAIAYEHFPRLGGLRHAKKDSVNQGWRNASFRGFADYMQTDEFQSGIEELIDKAARHRVAVMCAEAVPWRCHRSLIADALVVRGIRVEHITSATRASPHVLTPWAKVQGEQITYPTPSETAE